jgi:hypothetical protein
MTRGLRRRVRALQAYAAGASVAVIALVGSGLARSSNPTRIDELTVQRLNVVDANGTLRMVLSNKDRMHPGVIDGKTINRPRPVAGLLFFNDVGDEVGGLTFTGQSVNGQVRADARLMFDQWKQDQAIGVQYDEDPGGRSAGILVWDHSETQRLSDLIERLNAANAIADPAARSNAVQAVGAAAEPGYRRFFAGKDRDRASVVTLADSKGKARLVLKVPADGAASIEFLDANGQVVERLPK